MASYKVDYADTFFEDMEKLDKGTQKQIAKWIDKHLVGVDFPRSPGKYLTEIYLAMFDLGYLIIE